MIILLKYFFLYFPVFLLAEDFVRRLGHQGEFLQTSLDRRS